MSSFSLLQQPYYPICELGKVLTFLESKSDENALIGHVRFILKSQHYKLGLNKLMYVWRPKECIFIDFSVRKFAQNNVEYFQLLKEEKGHLILHDYIRSVDTKLVWDGCVVEAFWNDRGTTLIPGNEAAILLMLLLKSYSILFYSILFLFYSSRYV